MLKALTCSTEVPGSSIILGSLEFQAASVSRCVHVLDFSFATFLLKDKVESLKGSSSDVWGNNMNLFLAILYKYSSAASHTYQVVEAFIIQEYHHL